MFFFFYNLPERKRVFFYLDTDHYTAGIQRDLMRSWNNLSRQQFGR
jgi:uncharacterized protein (DUF2252 family)